jgi:hypothetical protein
MWRKLFLGMLIAGVLSSPLGAQSPSVGPDITYQWDYSCPSGGDCSFSCGNGGSSHVTKLGIYLGAIPVGTDQKNSTLFYEFTTRQLRQGSGFNINAGLNKLQCQVNGLTVDYAGPPRTARRIIEEPRTIDTPMSLNDKGNTITTGSVMR